MKNICEFEWTKYGMLKQKDAKPMEYLESYTVTNSRTNSDMSYLRLGNLLGHVPYDVVFKGQHLEIGPGNGINLAIWRSKGIKIEGYDIAKSIYSTITKDRLYSDSWDILCAFDVLEHYEDIDEIWNIHFKYGYFSVPRLPDNGVLKDLRDWRHFRLGEHIYNFSEKAFEKWVNVHGYSLIYFGCPEDCIRERWNFEQPNINSYIIKRME